MPSERLPWVVVKRNRRGDERYYWQRRGHGTKRLSDDPVVRLGQVVALNRTADWRDGETQGSLAWCISRYRESLSYGRLKPPSRVVYDRWLNHFERSRIGQFPVGDIDRPAVLEIRDALLRRHGLATVNHALVVLRLVLELARDRGMIVNNPASRPKIGRPPARQAVWTDDEVTAVLAAAPAPIALGFKLLLYTAQRPSDVVRMAWSQFDGEMIRLRQQKTGALVEVAAHRELRAALDAETRRGPLIAVKASGRAWTADGLAGAIGAAMAKAGVTGLQVRDLRRTAVVKLAEAGATVPEIASVTGHKLQTAAVILQTYLPRTGEQSRAAVMKWEQKR